MATKTKTEVLDALNAAQQMLVANEAQEVKQQDIPKLSTWLHTMIEHYTREVALIAAAKAKAEDKDVAAKNEKIANQLTSEDLLNFRLAEDAYREKNPFTLEARIIVALSRATYTATKEESVEDAFNRELAKTYHETQEKEDIENLKKAYTALFVKQGKTETDLQNSKNAEEKLQSELTYQAQENNKLSQALTKSQSNETELRKDLTTLTNAHSILQAEHKTTEEALNISRTNETTLKSQLETLTTTHQQITKSLETVTHEFTTLTTKHIQTTQSLNDLNTQFTELSEKEQKTAHEAESLKKIKSNLERQLHKIKDLNAQNEAKLLEITSTLKPIVSNSEGTVTSFQALHGLLDFYNKQLKRAEVIAKQNSKARSALAKMVLYDERGNKDLAKKARECYRETGIVPETIEEAKSILKEFQKTHKNADENRKAVLSQLKLEIQAADSDAAFLKAYKDQLLGQATKVLESLKNENQTLMQLTNDLLVGTTPEDTLNEEAGEYEEEKFNVSVIGAEESKMQSPQHQRKESESKIAALQDEISRLKVELSQVRTHRDSIIPTPPSVTSSNDAAPDAPPMAPPMAPPLAPNLLDSNIPVPPPPSAPFFSGSTPTPPSGGRGDLLSSIRAGSKLKKTTAANQTTDSTATSGTSGNSMMAEAAAKRANRMVVFLDAPPAEDMKLQPDEKVIYKTSDGNWKLAVYQRSKINYEVDLQTITSMQLLIDALNTKGAAGFKEVDKKTYSSQINDFLRTYKPATSARFATVAAPKFNTSLYDLIAGAKTSPENTFSKFTYYLSKDEKTKEWTLALMIPKKLLPTEKSQRAQKNPVSVDIDKVEGLRASLQLLNPQTALVDLSPGDLLPSRRLLKNFHENLIKSGDLKIELEAAQPQSTVSDSGLSLMAMLQKAAAERQKGVYGEEKTAKSPKLGSSSDDEFD